MEQEPKKHVSHWIAWSIIALVVGIAAFGCWYFSDQIATIYDTMIVSTPKKTTTKTTATPAATPTPTTTTVADWKTYINSTYGFTMTFSDGWKGYKAVERVNTTDPLVTDDIYFALPTTDTSWTESGLAQLDNYATPFVVSVYTLANWDKAVAESQGGEMPTEITRNSKYVFAWSGWQACPTDLCGNDLAIKALVASFKFN